MEITRTQQLYFLPLGLLPGILAFLKIITPAQAGCIVLLAFILSRRHANALQKKFERETAEAEKAAKEEAERFASLPSKQRKAILRARARDQAQEGSGEGDS